MSTTAHRILGVRSLRGYRREFARRDLGDVEWRRLDEPTRASERSP